MEEIKIKKEKFKEYRETVLKPKSTEDLVKIREAFIALRFFTELWEECKELYFIDAVVCDEIFKRRHPERYAEVNDNRPEPKTKKCHHQISLDIRCKDCEKEASASGAIVFNN